ncbi:alpha-L-rhamnosidase N-terminal domain-containing protein [Paenibacillus sp. JCM 10914]|uniref:glycoside hydrolase family 78 protein n=1 Tax=Paenibacillus sp. JCM 10914 TaxID=1236974 RepID=UPI0003CC9F48|nr:alfa-L-rhamnosidase [Paenibacillus sp. JCM 10914]
MVKVTDLRCEYKSNPVGIGERHPRISWKLQSDERAVSQSAYEIEVAEDDQFASLIWSSGTVTSSQSVHVELNEVEAQSCKRYYYRVRVISQAGQESDWSDTAFWEMGIMAGETWVGEWITTPSSLIPEASTQPPLLRRGFQIDSAIKQARIYATALGLYELELNGQR